MPEGKRPARQPHTAPKRRSASPSSGGSRLVVRPPGYQPRAAAVRIIAGVLHSGRSLDEAVEGAFAVPAADGMEPRDRGFARLIAMTVLRQHGVLEAVIGGFLGKPLPERTGLLKPILLGAAAQLLFLETPAHAAISLAVDQTRADTGARRFDRLTNAVLRKVATLGAERLATLDAVKLNIPDWLLSRWAKTYGGATAREIAIACLTEPALDLSVKAEPAAWASRLGGIVLPTGTVRLKAAGRIEDLEGYGDGAWWVQDAAAALPGRLLGPVGGIAIADLCAAPGGKTAELAAAGARVTAVDISEKRLGRLKDNLTRLRLDAEVIAADIETWAPARAFDGVLLDAPCTSTGTIRRHPDILRLKRAGDLAPLADLQSRLLERASQLVSPGGVLVYCSCSLEPEEGAMQIAPFLSRHPEFTRDQVRADEIGGLTCAITDDGDLRTLPQHLANDDPHLSGIDGFFAARLRRTV